MTSLKTAQEALVHLYSLRGELRRVIKVNQEENYPNGIALEQKLRHEYQTAFEAFKATTRKSMKTSDLIGEDLDFAVSLAIGEESRRISPSHYSTDNTHGGPLIDEYNISTVHQWNGKWWAFNGADDSVPKDGFGPTRLIAAMRCIVTIKLGDEVNF